MGEVPIDDCVASKPWTHTALQHSEILQHEACLPHLTRRRPAVASACWWWPASWLAGVETSASMKLTSLVAEDLARESPHS
jgi:hypothetical protein